MQISFPYLSMKTEYLTERGYNKHDLNNIMCFSSSKLRGRFVADDLPVIHLPHSAFVDEQVGVANHLREGEEGWVTATLPKIAWAIS